MKGIIKKIVADKSFGFITEEGKAHDTFFHKDKLVGVEFESLHEGDAVTFETEEVEQNGEKKTNAINVQKA